LHEALLSNSGNIVSYLKLHWDAYPLLISFAVICGVIWIFSFFVALFSRIVFLILGAVNFIIFVSLFSIIAVRIRPPIPCKLYVGLVNSTSNHNDAFRLGNCKTDGNWYDLHSIDSYGYFWGSSIACLGLAAYQIIVTAYMVWEEYLEEEQKRKKAQEIEMQNLNVQKNKDQVNTTKKTEEADKIHEEKKKEKKRSKKKRIEKKGETKKVDNNEEDIINSDKDEAAVEKAKKKENENPDLIIIEEVPPEKKENNAQNAIPQENISNSRDASQGNVKLVPEEDKKIEPPPLKEDEIPPDDDEEYDYFAFQQLPQQTPSPKSIVKQVSFVISAKH